MNTDLWFITDELRLLFEDVNLKLLELLDKLKGVFTVDTPVEENLVPDNLDALFIFRFFFRRRHS